jgi:hypothetical protein
MRLEKSEDLDNVYKLFGVCAHHCSNIEYHIAFLLHPVKWKKHWAHLQYKKQETQKGGINERVAAMRKFDEALANVEQDIDDIYSVPLGNLIRQVNDNYPLSDEQNKYLREILEKRNYVIHKMWGDYGRRLKDPLVVKEMLSELQTYEPYFRSASDWLRKQSYLLNGIPEEIETNK